MDMAHPTRHRRIPDDAKSKPSNGLLSHVFSFVSREFESFVLNATARPANQLVSTGRVKSSGRRRGRDSERNMSEDEARYRSRFQHHQERERPFKPKLSRRKPRSKSTDSTRKCRHDHLQPTYIIDDDRVLSASDRDRSKSPTPRPPSVFPVPPPPKLKKKPSVTMPGALFPRSPSLVPDKPDRDQCTHAASDVPISVQPSHPPYDSDLDEAEAGPSWTHSSTVPSADSVDPDRPSLDEYVSPWRIRSVASVKDAVHRFNATEGAEADFSLMLPSPHASPVKPVSKARSVDEASPHRPTSNPPPPPTTSRKGKERARDSRHDDDLDFIVCGGSGHDGVYAKERELDAAREEQRKHERLLSGDQSRRASDERKRDKRRIKALEEEVRWLKGELSRSQVRTSPPPSFPPPAPPPPPPPPPPLPLRIDTTPCTPTSMFSTARASLRHAMTPVEAPINNPGLNRTRRQGQPTVNVPSEKMAAFLHEIKTAKLRRVGPGANAMGGDGVAGPSGLSKSVNVTTSSASTGPAKLSAQELLRRRSLANLRVPIGSSLAASVPPSTAKEPEVRVGQKRKADTLGVDEVTGVPSKRRMTQSSFQSSSSGMSQHTAAPPPELSTRSSLSLQPRPLPTNETDVTTPSLCSDNDRDENSIEDRVPSTPPGPRATTVTQKASKTDAPEEQIEVIDVDMEEQSHPEPGTISPNSVPRRTSELFKKRPPTSPIPIPTPRRPSAPARTKRGATPKPKSLPSLESDVNEDGALSQSAPVPFLSLIPVPKTKPTKPKAKPILAGKGRPRAALQQQNGRLYSSSSSGSSSQNRRRKAHKRRQTLDEELRTAEARSSDIDECNDEPDPEEKEDDVFIATGTKSKRRGFLAHGGGGGAPVFMGVGYVQGVPLDSEDDSDEDGVTGAQLRRSFKSAGQASLIPRPKART